MTPEPRFSKRAESTLALLKAHPTKAPTIVRQVDNTGRDSIKFYEGDRRSPKSRYTQNQAQADGCFALALLPVLLYRRIRGVL